MFTISFERCSGFLGVLGPLAVKALSSGWNKQNLGREGNVDLCMAAGDPNIIKKHLVRNPNTSGSPLYVKHNLMHICNIHIIYIYVHTNPRFLNQVPTLPPLVRLPRYSAPFQKCG